MEPLPQVQRRGRWDELGVVPASTPRPAAKGHRFPRDAQNAHPKPQKKQANLPQDVLALIIESLSDCSTLRACAEAHSSLRGVAQAMLFRRITLRIGMNDNLDSKLECFRSTSFARHVRIVDIRRYGVYNGATRDDTRLRRVLSLLAAYEPNPATRGRNRRRTQLRKSSSQVTTLRLFSMQLPLQTLIDIVCAFPCINTLYFRQCACLNLDTRRDEDDYYPSEDSEDDMEGLPLRRAGTKMPDIRRLTVLNSPQLSQFLHRLFPHRGNVQLHSLVFQDSSSTQVAFDWDPVLKRAGRELEDLTVQSSWNLESYPGECIKSINLSANSRLQVLHLYGVYFQHEDFDSVLLPTLRSIRSHALEKIVLERCCVSVNSHPDQLKAALQSLDRLLSDTAQFSVLRHFGLTRVTYDEGDSDIIFENEFFDEYAHAFFPRLIERGIIFLDRRPFVQ